MSLYHGSRICQPESDIEMNHAARHLAHALRSRCRGETERWAVVFVSALPLLPCCALARTAHADAKISASGDGLFADLTRGVQPGADVLVIRDGKIVHEAAYGYADVENKIPLTV